jgi:hypothetical protein
MEKHVICENCNDEECACISPQDESYNEYMQQESLTLTKWTYQAH